MGFGGARTSRVGGHAPLGNEEMRNVTHPDKVLRTAYGYNGRHRMDSVATGQATKKVRILQSNDNTEYIYGQRKHYLNYLSVIPSNSLMHDQLCTFRGH